MAHLYKHRLERKDFAFGFSDQLDEGDGLSSVDSIVVTKIDGESDVASEFGSPSGAVNGDDVEATFGAAASGEQDEGTYEIRVKAITDGGDELVATDADGDLFTLAVGAS